MAIRTDLQNKANAIGDTMTPKVGPSNQYGEVKKLMDGLKQVPSGPAAGDRGVAAQQPRERINLSAMTNRPNEPITAGMDFGPGVSSVGAGVPRQYTNDIAMMEIKEILKYFPNDDLFDLVSRYGGG